jgi:anthraniloyl-CoA monooxygenase
VKTAILGGGPGGLYLAMLLRQVDPDGEVVVFERNAPGDTFGFGVVFSDETLAAVEAADPPSYAEISASFARWEDIDIHYLGEALTSTGHGFAALARVRLLDILARRAAVLGADLRYRTEAVAADLLAGGDYDLVVAADGANSRTRAAYADVFRPELADCRNRYMWLGTTKVFEAFTFHVIGTPDGVFRLHCYPYDASTSTFIVETDPDTWRRSGLDITSPERCAELFAGPLDGHPVISNRSRWQTFTTVRCQTWRHSQDGGHLVLLGDAAHTAHFSIGSGTKLAMEDAIALAWAISEHPGAVDAALKAYEAERQPAIASVQRAAQASLEWFEGIGRYVRQHPLQFAFNLLTRSRRITYDELRLRDPDLVAAVDSWFAADQGQRPSRGRPPMFLPFTVRELTLPNRIVVSPMDMYRAVDGTPGDFHLVHLGSRAVGGAGLVMTEMVCVTAEGRITPGCGGLYAPEHVPAWRRIVDFVHAETGARIGVQLGHSGRKGSTKLMWQGIDQPLEDGNWPLVAPSALPYLPGISQVPAELDRSGLDSLRDAFVDAALRAEECGFDLLELHMGHGYLLSSFLTPVANTRTDAYGGDLAGRARWPLEVFDAVRAAWPARKPMSVRISATDWVDGGFDGDQAVEFARMLRDHGCDLVDVSTGQTTPAARPAYGRSYQTPYADRIRHEAGIPVVAVGAISSPDDANQIILSGRADLCALARPHLYDPYWTLHAATDYGCVGQGADWPDPYLAGNRKPVTGKDAPPKPPTRRFTPPAPTTRPPRRWLPDTST